MKITETQLRARYKKWTDALRSGKYKQGREYLKSWDGYCCLGVLVDLGDNVKRTENEWVSGNCIIGHIGAFPPKFILDALLLKRRRADKLADMNDNDGKTFTEIAEYIENEILPEALRRINEDH